MKRIFKFLGITLLTLLTGISYNSFGQWNYCNGCVSDANSNAIGFNTNASNLSTAMGYLTIASGPYSTALGRETQAQGNYSIVMGRYSVASGNTSTAMGYATNAEGLASTTIGGFTTASGSYATAMGYSTIASGDYAIATGSNSKAIGLNSTAMGNLTEASGESAFATGEKTKAIGVNSTAMGRLTEAEGISTTALGDSSMATGDYATVIGLGSVAGGTSTLALGTSAKANGNYAISIGTLMASNGFGSVAIGFGSTVGGIASIGLGRDNIISADSAIAIGIRSTANGNRAVAIGSFSTADAYNTTALGRYNIGGGDGNSWIETDPILEVGIGSSDENRANALTILKNGRVGIGISTPDYLLHVNGTAAKPGGGSWEVASDKRLKQNIKDFKDGLDIIQKIEPVTFQYNGRAGLPTEKEYVGIIAQDIQQIAPYMVGAFEYKEGETKKDYLSFDPSALDFILINAIKEQQALIDELKQEIQSLRNDGNQANSTLRESHTNHQYISDNEVIILEQNRPNPFHKNTSIAYAVPNSVAKAHIYIYDMNGKQLKDIEIKERGNGSIQIEGNTLKAGMYLYTLIADGKEAAVKRMILTD